MASKSERGKARVAEAVRRTTVFMQMSGGRFFYFGCAFQEQAL
jgi:hypothetical protein